jgi:hypothetical protein
MDLNFKIPDDQIDVEKLNKLKLDLIEFFHEANVCGIVITPSTLDQPCNGCQFWYEDLKCGLAKRCNVCRRCKPDLYKVKEIKEVNKGVNGEQINKDTI